MDLNVRRDKYRTNLELGVDIAYKTTARYESEPTINDTTSPTRLVYDVYTEDNTIERVMLREDLIESQSTRSLKEEHQHPDFEWLHPPESVYPDEDYTPPDRRVTIQFGETPFIHLNIEYDRTIHVPPDVYFYWREQLFVPKENEDHAVFTHRVVDADTLENWVFEFVPRDPLDLHNEPEFQFLLGDDWEQTLETELTEYFFNKAFESETLVDGALFEPGYICGLLDCSWDLAEQLCRNLTGDSGPLSLVVAAENDQFEDYDFACASPDYWDDGDVYDYSTRYYPTASIDRETGRIWV